jgi:hypothetical protein
MGAIECTHVVKSAIPNSSHFRTTAAKPATHRSISARNAAGSPTGPSSGRGSTPVNPPTMRHQKKRHGLSSNTGEHSTARTGWRRGKPGTRGRGWSAMNRPGIRSSSGCVESVSKSAGYSRRDKPPVTISTPGKYPPMGMRGDYTFGGADGIPFPRIRFHPLRVRRNGIREPNRIPFPNSVPSDSQGSELYFAEWNSQFGKFAELGQA